MQTAAGKRFSPELTLDDKDKKKGVLPCNRRNKGVPAGKSKGHWTEKLFRRTQSVGNRCLRVILSSMKFIATQSAVFNWSWGIRRAKSVAGNPPEIIVPAEFICSFIRNSSQRNLSGIIGPGNRLRRNVPGAIRGDDCGKQFIAANPAES